jgi:hypothetical protein
MLDASPKQIEPRSAMRSVTADIRFADAEPVRLRIV